MPACHYVIYEKKLSALISETYMPRTWKRIHFYLVFLILLQSDNKSLLILKNYCLFRRIARDGGGIPRPISKAVKNCPNLGKNALIVVIDG